MKRTDKNHKLIADTLRSLGFAVVNTSAIGDGFPDIIASRRKNTYLIEVKGEHGKLTPKQIEFIKKWQDRIFVVTDEEDCIKLSRGKLKSINS